MSLSLLFKDELKGFYKSKVMIFLWVGMPLTTILLNLLPLEDLEGITFTTTLSVILVSNIAGILASLILAVSIINEKNRHVYDLFIIRPIKRRDILIAKFFAVYICMAVATLLSIASGLTADYFTEDEIPEMSDLEASLVLSLSILALACSMGILIGVEAPSILIGVILVVFVGNPASAVSMVPALLKLPHPLFFTIVSSGIVTGILLFAAIVVFDRKEF